MLACDNAVGGAEPKLKVTKLPKELELPQMKDHQMFDRPRIVELQNELQDKFKSLKVGSEAVMDVCLFFSLEYAMLAVSCTC